MVQFYKICRICGVEKPLHYFHKCKTCRDGHENRCNECCSKIKKKYYISNKEYIDNRNKKYRDENSEKMQAQARKTYRENIEKSREYKRNRTRVWRKNNPEKSKESYRKSHATRKHFGFNPLNNWFLNSEGHHLHINNHDDIIYSPIELHKSIKHSYKDSLSMYKINKIIFEWYWKELIIGDIQWL